MGRFNWNIYFGAFVWYHLKIKELPDLDENIFYMYMDTIARSVIVKVINLQMVKVLLYIYNFAKVMHNQS